MTGGIAHSLDSYLKTGQSPGLGIILANAFVSGFSGYMVAQVALKLYPDWAFVVAGVGGYLGTKAIDWLSEAARKRFDPPTEKKE